MRSRPGPIAPTIRAPMPRAASASAAAPASHPCGCSTGSSSRSNPKPRARSASSPRRASVSVDTHTHVLTPISRTAAPFTRSGDDPILPDLREARQVLAAELRVVAIGHALVADEILIEFIGRDRILRQDPFGGHLLTFEDHL